MLSVTSPSNIFIKMFNLYSPTLGDILMEVIINLGGAPVLLYDPVFINEITKFLLNISEQNKKETF